MQVNAEQMEARVLLRRTHERVNKLIAYYWRANHDVTVLIDAAHCKRYNTKYVAKSSKHLEIMTSVLEYLNSKPMDAVPRNIKHALIHILLANNFQRTFISAMETAYKAMDLPLVLHSFAEVKVVGCYNRSTLFQNRENPNEEVYNNRTKYSAYAEQYDNSTRISEKSGLTRDEIEAMNLRDFAECVYLEWKKYKRQETTDIDHKGKMKLKSCFKGSGYWLLTKHKKEHMFVLVQCSAQN